MLFCAKFGVSNPFPISQALLCYYVAYLANNGLAYQTIKTYLTAIRHIQIAQGLPEPKQYASMPKLKVVEKGVRKIRALDKPSSNNTCHSTPDPSIVVSKVKGFHSHNALGSGLHRFFF